MTLGSLGTELFVVGNGKIGEIGAMDVASSEANDGATRKWDIRDSVLPQNIIPDHFDNWPQGPCKRAYCARTSIEASRHSSGWAMRNTNNHNVNILKKSCLGVLVCDRHCKEAVTQGRGALPVYWRPAICDKARQKQLNHSCRTPGCKGTLQLQRCQGRSGYPVTHFWRTDGHGRVFFQAKGTHDHPRPVKLYPGEGRLRRGAVRLLMEHESGIIRRRGIRRLPRQVQTKDQTEFDVVDENNDYVGREIKKEDDSEMMHPSLYPHQLPMNQIHSCGEKNIGWASNMLNEASNAWPEQFNFDNVKHKLKSEADQYHFTDRSEWLAPQAIRKSESFAADDFMNIEPHVFVSTPPFGMSYLSTPPCSVTDSEELIQTDTSELSFHDLDQRPKISRNQFHASDAATLNGYPYRYDSEGWNQTTPPGSESSLTAASDQDEWNQLMSSQSRSYTSDDSDMYMSPPLDEGRFLSAPSAFTPPTPDKFIRILPNTMDNRHPFSFYDMNFNEYDHNVTYSASAPPCSAYQKETSVIENQREKKARAGELFTIQNGEQFPRYSTQSLSGYMPPALSGNLEDFRLNTNNFDEMYNCREPFLNATGKELEKSLLEKQTSPTKYFSLLDHSITESYSQWTNDQTNNSPNYTKYDSSFGSSYCPDRTNPIHHHFRPQHSQSVIHISPTNHEASHVGAFSSSLSDTALTAGVHGRGEGDALDDILIDLGLA